MSYSILKQDDPQLPEKTGNLASAVGVGTTTAATFGLAGFFLINDESGAMGSVLFLLLPIFTGMATALMVRGRKVALASLLVGAIICSSILLITKMEGWVCLLMSTPLIAIGLAIGAVGGTLIRAAIDRSKKQSGTSLMVLVALPFLLIGANSAEEPLRRTPRVETFANTLVVDSSRELAWNQLKTFDQIRGSKGLLMTIGLPVPVSCTMSGEGVGATRTCYFEQGHIQERVIEWNPPSSMKLVVTEFDVPGRPWLSFQDASYDLTEEDGRTVITRKTTVVSRLSPAWYWRRMEKIGVETEHEYLFEEIERKINAARP